VTAQLVQLYEEAGEDRNFEIVLFGYDSDQKAIESYLKKSNLAFPAVKKNEMQAVAKLGELGNTGFIPNTVLVTPDGNMVTNDRDEVMETLRTL